MYPVKPLGGLSSLHTKKSARHWLRAKHSRLKEVILKWLLLGNLDVMTATIPGSFPMERGGRGIVPPAKVETFTERRKIGGTQEVGVQDKAGDAVEATKNPNNNEERK